MQFNSRIPIYLQVINQIKKQMALSELSPGDKLPSSRELAIRYSINPNTANRVYKEMELMGLCFTKRGLGTFVTEDTHIVQGIKQDMAKEYVQRYIEAMKSLGFSQNEMVEAIQNTEE